MVKTKYKLLGLLILNLGLLAVANDKFDDKPLEGRIYGGNDAAPGKWNFYCSLAVIKTQKEVFICGCVVIGSKWVASATHCTVDHPASNIHVYAGYPTSRFLNYEQNIVARAKYEHPDYDPNYNDLPVALPLSSGDVAGVGTTCRIAGFGETRSEKADEKDRTLQEGTVFVSKRFECLFAYGSYIRNSHICANNPHATTGVCRGDSGGPLVCRDHGRGVDVLRGVVSFGLDGCGDRLTPEVWTRISFYVDWIKTTMTECDFPELPPNTYTKNSPPGGKFKVGEILNLFCSDGYEQRSGSDMSVCGKDGSFDELDLKCIAKGLYGDWKIGSCSVTCGEGTRQDTRECLGGVCSEDLHRIAVCRLQPCPTGDDVCKSLHCSPHAACEMSDGEHKCVCLVEYEGDGVNCTRIENGPAPVANNSSDAPAYTGWKLGKCVGICGAGKRTETRMCARGDCNEELSRVAECELPDCTDAHQCLLAGLECSENAECQRSSDAEFTCKCLPGFAGDGVTCSFANGLKNSFWQTLLSFIVIRACLL